MAVIDFVKFDGSPDVFAWKFPDQQLSTWTQLIVNETQEAILYKGGKALDLFGPGRHVLETANIPLLTSLIGLPFGGKSPFTAEVWFVNKIVSMDIKWGTPSPIQLQDPKYKVFLPVRSYGQFAIKIEDSRRFLTSLVGTLPYFDKEQVTNYFKGIYLTKVKDAISSFILKEGISVLEINASLEEISDYIYEKMLPEMNKYGIAIVNFNINDISVPETDSAVKKLKDALAKRAEMDILGYNYQQERSFDTLVGAAQNEAGLGSVMGAGIGLGMGVGIGTPMGQQASQLTSQIEISEKKKECPKCHEMITENVKFCPMCGADTREKIEKECPHCHSMIPISAKFCPECGKSIQKTCPKCGMKIDEKIKFCPECGEKL